MDKHSIYALTIVCFIIAFVTCFVMRLLGVVSVVGMCVTLLVVASITCFVASVIPD